MSRLNPNPCAIGQARLPRLPLIRDRTPVHELPSLARRLGLGRLWIKRDDLIPFGFGGNKMRGLEFLAGEAMAEGADTLITGAGPLSNHVRATAAVGAACGLHTVAVYWGKDCGPPSGNFGLTCMLGAQVRFTGSYDRASVDGAMDALAAELAEAGRKPYVIPRGGAAPLGVVGHVLAVREVMQQFAELETMPNTVLMPVGSGGTLAGWLLGSRHFGAPWRVEAVTVSRPADEAKAQVLRLLGETERLLGVAAGVGEGKIVIHDGHIGAGYGIPSEAGSAAIRLAAVEEGVFLDPVYTGKTLAGLIHLCETGRFGGGESVLFLHTGGQPGLFVPGQSPVATINPTRNRYE